jgi:aryl-alcohol dehydrogenase-like predicted oxidoreductase
MQPSLPGHKGGESETIIGKWLIKTGKRKDVIVATKVGMDMGDGKNGLKAGYIHKAVEDSLQRLQTDYIDIYQAHQDDKDTPLEETLGTFDDLVKQGKVRHIGASNYSGARLAEALETSRKHGLASYTSLQPHYNLVERQQYETDLSHRSAIIGRNKYSEKPAFSKVPQKQRTSTPRSLRPTGELGKLSSLRVPFYRVRFGGVQV